MLDMKFRFSNKVVFGTLSLKFRPSEKHRFVTILMTRLSMQNATFSYKFVGKIVRDGKGIKNKSLAL